MARKAKALFELFSRSDNVVAAPVDDMLIMLDMEQGKYFGLNEVAARIWSLCEQPTTGQRVVEALLQEYDVDAKRCTEQVEIVLHKLRARNLITYVG